MATEFTGQRLQLLSSILKQLKELNGVREYDGVQEDEETARRNAAEGFERLSEADIETQESIFGPRIAARKPIVW
eukprot:SAG31_NODE_3894_length_3774_cov_2.376599_3_plen_75_part_00